MPAEDLHVARDLRARATRSGADWFEGTVHELELYDPGDTGASAVWAIWFDAGSRAKPHVHSFDQVLHVIEGEGIVATRERRQRLLPGDWATIPRGVWHWHGATPDQPVCHVTIQLPGRSTDWDVPRHDFDDYRV